MATKNGASGVGSCINAKQHVVSALKKKLRIIFTFHFLNPENKK